MFDSGNDFERINAEILPDFFNCFDNTVEMEDRFGKKAPEPESVTIGTVENRIYDFIAPERTGGIMMYDITEPADTVKENMEYEFEIRTDILE